MATKNVQLKNGGGDLLMPKTTPSMVITTKDITSTSSGYYNGLAKTACTVGATFNTGIHGGSWLYQAVPCTAGDVFYLTASGSSALYCYAIIDDDNKVKRVGTQTASNKMITINSGETKLMISSDSTKTTKILKEISITEIVADADNVLQTQIDRINGFEKFYDSKLSAGNNFFIYGNSTIFVVIDSYGENATSSSFKVYKDDALIYTLTKTTGVCPRWCFLDGDTLYFASVIRSTLIDASAPATQDTIRLFTLDLTTLTWAEVGSAITRDMVYRVRYHYTFVSFVKFNGVLYATMSNQQAGRGVSSVVQAYSIDEYGFNLIGSVATDEEHWGKGTDSSIYLNYESPAYGTLSTDGTYVYCRYICDSGLVLVKRTTDMENWEKYEILGATKFKQMAVFGDAMLNTAVPFFYGCWNNDQYGLCTDEKDEYKYINVDALIKHLSGASSVSNRRVILHNGYIYIYGRYTSDSGHSTIWKCDPDVIYRMMCGQSLGDIYTNDISKVPFGYSAVMTKAVTTSLYKYNTGISISQYATGNANEKIVVPNKAIVRVLNLGTSKGYQAFPVDYGNGVQRSVFLHCYPFYNDFQSIYFRSPDVCLSANGDIIHALGAARYVNLTDAVLMEPIYGRSYDGGRTWVDKRVLIPRPTGGSYISSVRVGGGLFITDTDESSAHYGRIYVLSEIINSTNNDDFMDDLQVVLTHSDDNGTTWHGAWDNSDADGSYLDITSQVVPNNYSELGWKRFNMSDNLGKTFVGGTHNGMLYFSMWIDYGSTTYKPTIVYSTDHGQTWNLGPIAATGNESAIVQTDNHTLVMNTRPNNGSASQRLFYQLDISDGIANASWTAISGTNSPTQVTQEGWARINDVYLCTRPIGTDAQGYLKSKITLFKSRDLVNWEKIISLTPLGTRSTSSWVNVIAYSNIVVDKNHLGVLLETKEASIEYYNLDYLLPYILS